VKEIQVEVDRFGGSVIRFDDEDEIPLPLLGRTLIGLAVVQMVAEGFDPGIRCKWDRHYALLIRSWVR
jgi:hypothetical protein